MSDNNSKTRQSRLLSGSRIRLRLSYVIGLMLLGTAGLLAASHVVDEQRIASVEQRLPLVVEPVNRVPPVTRQQTAFLDVDDDYRLPPPGENTTPGDRAERGENDRYSGDRRRLDRRRGPPRPPAFAFDACEGLTERASCVAKTPHGDETGICASFDQGLACIPKHHRGGGPRERDSGANDRRLPPRDRMYDRGAPRDASRD